MNYCHRDGPMASTPRRRNRKKLMELKQGTLESCPVTTGQLALTSCTRSAPHTLLWDEFKARGMDDVEAG